MIRVKSSSPPSPWVIEENPQLDPEIKARLLAGFDQHAVNLDWYQAHADAIHRDHPGQYVLVIDGQVFTGLTHQEADAAAQLAYPDKLGGAFRMYIRPPAAG